MKIIKAYMKFLILVVLTIASVDFVVAYGVSSSEEMVGILLQQDVVNPIMAIVSTIVVILIGLIVFITRNYKRNS